MENRVNCSYANNDIWNKTYIGRMQVKLNDGNKTKTLYFPVNEKIIIIGRCNTN